MTAQVLKPKATVEKLETGIDDREHLAKALTGCLADTYILMVKTQAYHWNVVGPLFVSIHELTEQHYQNLFKAADELAERVRALGYPTISSTEEMKMMSVVGEESGNPDAEQMIENLVKDHETVAKRFRETGELAEEHHDPVTADMLTERIQFHEQAVWMLKAIITKS
jgi:starvation-inducible DNA-binding protein